MVLGIAGAAAVAGGAYMLGQYHGRRRLRGLLNGWGAGHMTSSELELAVRRFVRYQDSEYAQGKGLGDLWKEERKTVEWCHPGDGSP
jgi:hypothetical protein